MTFIDVIKSIELNFTDLCNLQCSFCPHAFGFKSKDNNVHMTPDIAKVIKNHLDEFNYSHEVIISGKGEPTLNIYFEKLIDILADPQRKYKIKLITNGKNLWKYKKSLEKIDIIYYDVYDIKQDGLQYKKDIEKEFKNVQVLLKPDYGELEVKKFTEYGSNMSSRGYEEHITKELDDTTCSIVFEKLMIDWNGDYNLCCHDWFNRISLGNVTTETILEYIEENPILMSYRTNLVEGNRKDLTVCKNCDKFCPIKTNTYKDLMDMYNACR